jgi:predicted permease
LRRTLLAESLVLCVAGATLGVLIARPLLSVLARYASRFSVRALDLTVDASMLWVGAILAVISAVLLAYVPHLPTANTSQGSSLANGSFRITGNTNRRLRIFAVTQIAASFMLLAGASMLLKTLLSMQTAQTGLDTRRVLAINVPAISYGKTPQQVADFYKESMRRIDALPGVDKTAFGILVPWRDAGTFGPGFQFSADGHVRAPGEEDPRAQLRSISSGFFAALGVPIIAGRDFNALDGQSKEPVVIVSETLAKRMFPTQDAVNRHVYWTDPVMKFIDISAEPRRIIGVAADIDDEHVVPGPTLTVYSPFDQGEIWGGRLFIHTSANPYSLVSPITKIIRDMSVDQPIERAATLEDVRAEVLTPDRLNTVVFGVFAGVALAIALVGVAGVLAFSVSARTREFGIRLALGSPPQHLLAGVIVEGAIMAIAGVAAGAAGGYLLARFAGSYFLDVRMPSALPVIVSAVVLLAAAVIASAVPAARAARVDVMQALRSD